MRKRTVGMVVVAMMLGGIARADETQRVDLRPTWQEGQTSHYRINQAELTTADLGPAGQPQSLANLTVDVTWHVVHASEGGGGTAQMTIDNIKMKVTDPKGGTHRASLDEADKGMEGTQKWITAVCDSPLEIEVGPDGTIGSVSGLSAIHQKAPELAKKLNESYFQELAMDVATLAGGRSGLEAGSTWPVNFDGSNQNGKIHYRATNRLVKVEQVAGIGLATVQRTAKLAFEPELPELPAGAPSIAVKMTRGDYSGQLLFDLSRHELVGSRFTQRIDLQVSVSLRGKEVRRSTSETTVTQVLRVSEE